MLSWLVRWPEITDGSLRIIPVRLDDTSLPMLLQPISWINAEDEGAVGVARKIMRLNSSEQYIKAVQAEIEEAGLEFAYFHGYGVAVGCPRCGAPVGDLESWAATDYLRDDEYAGVRCKRCRWENGGETDITTAMGCRSRRSTREQPISAEMRNDAAVGVKDKVACR